MSTTILRLYHLRARVFRHRRRYLPPMRDAGAVDPWLRIRGRTAGRLFIWEKTCPN
jgi:hypothetical protein